MQILYTHKIINHVVPNPGLRWNYCPRNKIRITPKTSKKTGWIHTIRNNSYCVIGPLLFNALPRELRELPDLSIPTHKIIQNFKTGLDNYLKTKGF